MSEKKDYLDAIIIVGRTLILVPLFIAIISLASAYIFDANIFDGDSKSILFTYIALTLSGFTLIFYASYYRFKGD